MKTKLFNEIIKKSSFANSLIVKSKRALCVPQERISFSLGQGGRAHCGRRYNVKSVNQMNVLGVIFTTN